MGAHPVRAAEQRIGSRAGVSRGAPSRADMSEEFWPLERGLKLPRATRLAELDQVGTPSYARLPMKTTGGVAGLLVTR